MSDRKLICSKYGKELPAMQAPPFPGAEGAKLFETVSQQAWDDWQALQVMLINEHRLSTADPASRKWLAEQRRLFFANEEHARPSGYRPPEV